MLIMGHDPENIAFGNTLTKDAHKDKAFHYMLSNPPYGVDWSKHAESIKKEAEDLGMSGRFGIGLPPTSDGQMLFLQHMISKMRNDEQGSRIAIVMNASSLFTGSAGSGPSEIRRWIFENDWLEAIIGLPTDIFYNTGIPTYVWLLTNRKAKDRQGKVQLIDASGEQFWRTMRKGLGSKRREIPKDSCDEITRIYAEMLNSDTKWGEFSKIFKTTDFGYREIRVERPYQRSFEITDDNLSTLRNQNPFVKLSDDDQTAIFTMLQEHIPKNKCWLDRNEFEDILNQASAEVDVKLTATVKKKILSALSKHDEKAKPYINKKRKPEADSDLRNHELIPLKENWENYFAREVLPYEPDAWVDKNYTDKKDNNVGRIGYEINFNRYFYKYIPPRSPKKINSELKALEVKISNLQKEWENE